VSPALRIECGRKRETVKNMSLAAFSLVFVATPAFAQSAPASPSPAAPVIEPISASPIAAASPAADEPVTLAGSRGFIKHHGWYIAPSFGGTSLDGRYSSLVGLRGAWLINRQFGIGLAGNAFGWDATGRIDSPRPDTRVTGGYGGLLLQYVFASDKLVHGSLDATVGAGALCFDAVSDRRSCNDAIGFYAFEPMANIELNVTSFMRIAVGGGYRFTAIEDRTTSYRPDVSGFVARSSIQFGQF
jgi:hypothetical protein